MVELKDTNVKAKMQQKDGTYVQVGLKTAEFNSVEEILGVLSR